MKCLKNRLRHAHLASDFVLEEKKKKGRKWRQQTETKGKHSIRAPFPRWLRSLGKCNGALRRLDAVQREMRTQASMHLCFSRKLQEEMGRDKNRGLTQAEVSDWIKRSAWQPGRLALARCSCHPLATHLAHKTLAQLVTHCTAQRPHVASRRFICNYR